LRIPSDVWVPIVMFLLRSAVQSLRFLLKRFQDANGGPDHTVAAFGPNERKPK